ncbi:MAG TPA: hypothetical protein VMJ65_17725 [Solirubrobacteraceae bacterium]|nr:hypothetical protein [Solirubrobacteraceae bacterium]
MMRNKKRALIAILAIGVLAAGGAAFTTAIASFPSDNTNTAAFGGTAIKGATAAGVSYTLSSDGQFVTSADVYFTTSQSANTVDAGFGDTSTDAQLIGCSAPSSTVGSGTYSADYDSHCDFAGSTTFGPAGVPVTQAAYFDASVTDKTGNVSGVTTNP